MILPILLVAAVFGAWRWHQNRQPGNWTAERATAYAMAMRYERDPKKLAHWANFFAKEGLYEQASALRNRTKIPAVHGEERTVRASVFRKALQSRNPQAIQDVAVHYERLGCGAAADFVRAYARGLALSQQIGSLPTGSMPPPPPFTVGSPLPGPGGPPPGTVPPPPADPAAAAQAALGHHFQHAPWLRGIGLSAMGDGSPCVQVNIAADDPAVRAAIPSALYGVPVAVQVVGDIVAQTPAAPPDDAPITVCILCARAPVKDTPGPDGIVHNGLCPSLRPAAANSPST